MAQTATQPDAIDQFIAMPKDERGKLFEQLAPEKQQSLLAEIKKRKGAQPVTAPAVSPPAQTQPQQEGFFGSLAHSFGIPTSIEEVKQMQQQRIADMKAHPVATAVRAIAGPAGQLLEGAGSGFMRSTAELGQAADAEIKDKNPYAAAEHTAYAVPFVGEGIKRGVEQLGPDEWINPAEAGTAVGTAIQTAPVVADPIIERGGVGPMARKLGEISKNMRGKIVETATGTGPSVTADLVKKTQTGNNAADSFSNIRSAIETAREKAKAIGNEKYNGVNDALNPIPADPEFMQGALVDSLEKIKGTSTETPILKDMTRKQQAGETPTYEDLQGYYSELGNEISKGTLAGDVYHAYNTLHEAIGDEMQRIADSQGKGEALTDARQYWRRMKQTFGKPLNATDSATSVLKATAPDMAEQDTLSNRIRLLGSFDSEIPEKFKQLAKDQEAAKNVPKPAPGETNKVGPEEVTAAKGEGLHGRAELVRKWGHRVAKYGVGLKALWDAYNGHFDGALGDVAGGVAGYKAAGWIANVLEKPEVVKLLTAPTEQDIAEIPPELRSQFPEIIKAAQKQGIKVDPKLAALVGAGTAALVGPRTKELQSMRQSQ